MILSKRQMIKEVYRKRKMNGCIEKQDCTTCATYNF